MALADVTPPFTGTGETGEPWGTHTRADGRHMQDVVLGVDGSNTPLGDAFGIPVRKAQLTTVAAAWTNATVINETANILSVALAGYPSVLISYRTTGTVTGGTIQFQVSDDGGTNWYTTRVSRIDSDKVDTTYIFGVDAVEAWHGNVPGATHFRVRLSTVVVGTGTVNVRVTPIASDVKAAPQGVVLLDTAGNVQPIAGDHNLPSEPMAARLANQEGFFTDIVDPINQLYAGYKFLTRQTGTLLVAGVANHVTVVWKITLGAMGTVAAETQVYFGPIRSTTATGINTANNPLVNVGSTAPFPSQGTFVMLGVETAYNGKTATQFQNCGNHPATTGGEAVKGGYARGSTDRAIFDHGFAPSTAMPYPGYVATGPFALGQGDDLLIATSADLVITVNLWYEQYQ
jgi:hypothetical protein